MMRIMKNKTLLTFLLILILVAFAIYYLMNKSNSLQIQVSKADGPVDITSIINNQWTILPTNNDYKNLSADQQALLKSFARSYFKDMNDSEEKKIENEDMLRLKYYDKDTAIFYVSNQKGSYFVNFYKIKNWENISEGKNYVNSNEITLKNYIILFSDKELFYFKPLSKEFLAIKNSYLVNNNETYVKIGGIVDDYEYSVDEKTNKLKVSVFKNTNKGDVENEKLRETDFVLP